MLAERENQYLITKIKTAISVGVRPLSMIFHEQPSAAWEPFDFKLLEAYQRLEDEICPRCGHPVWLCRSDSENIDFKVETGVCHAERALRKAEVQRIPDAKKRTEARKELKRAGEFYYTVPYVPPTASGSLPTRDEYLTSIAGRIGVLQTNEEAG